jgi:hypothetical protein
MTLATLLHCLALLSLTPVWYPPQVSWVMLHEHKKGTFHGFKSQRIPGNVLPPQNALSTSPLVDHVHKLINTSARPWKGRSYARITYATAVILAESHTHAHAYTDTHITNTDIITGGNGDSKPH